ncbi:conserved hypothetical membrane spanning protein [Catenulispora acidiphila DSM 44928]|uniref:Conserved hypothetical membrane spanning protein n=2 Tax=Catenulispora TaxID=414878 RepID=C7QBS3_CATAD|nr:conserved hypothetical membrane spanning protein [Catenulispora acidiphila DSM 44928]
MIRAGVTAGVVGGVPMAAWSMFMMHLSGRGWWTPLNLIAHTFWRSAPLDGTFSLLASVLGTAVHVVVAAVFGIAIAVVAGRRPNSRSMVIATGLLFASLVWSVMQFGVWRTLDRQAAADFTPWVMASGHFVFGIGAAAIASILVTDDGAGSGGRQDIESRVRARSA